MKQLIIASLFIGVIFLSACSFSYDIIIVNDSDKPIEVRYKITERGQFDDPMAKSIEDWNTEKSIRRFWTEASPWQNLPANQFETILGERIIRILPKQVVNIEHKGYNPISEDRGDLTQIIELKIISSNGEISYKGKLLLDQFEKDDLTFIKTFRDELKTKN